MSPTSRATKKTAPPARKSLVKSSGPKPVGPGKTVAPQPKTGPPAAPEHAATFGNYVVHCATDEPDGLPLRLFCENCETPTAARAAAQMILDAQRPIRRQHPWQIRRVEFLGLGVKRGYPS